MAERSFMAALLKGKCPQCKQGDLFKHPLKKISKFNVMNRTCPVCGVMFEPEPGFYQGAMYVGYAFLVAVIVIVSLVLYFFAGNPSDWTYILTVISVMIIIIPLNYRYSRIIYLYWFGGIRYRP